MTHGDWHRGNRPFPGVAQRCLACHELWPHEADPPTPATVIRALIDAGEGIRCYPSGAVGFDEWAETVEDAQLYLGQWFDEDGTWRSMETRDERIESPGDVTLGGEG